VAVQPRGCVCLKAREFFRAVRRDENDFMPRGQSFNERPAKNAHAAFETERVFQAQGDSHFRYGTARNSSSKFNGSKFKVQNFF
jgi:hypothetical protein